MQIPNSTSRAPLSAPPGLRRASGAGEESPGLSADTLSLSPSAAASADQPRRFAAPGDGQGIAFDKDGNAWVAGSAGTMKLSPEGKQLGYYDAPGDGHAIALDKDGNAWVAGSAGTMKLSPEGKQLGYYEAPGNGQGVGFDKDGNAWVAGSAGTMRHTP